MKRFPRSEWEVLFNGVKESTEEALPISTLEVGGVSVKGKPDLVFRHIKSGSVLIVEMKTWGGRGRLPPFGWPNLKVQLWCYGMIDLWRNAPNVFLQGWVWRWGSDNYPDSGPRILFPGLVLQPWLASDPRVHSESMELFEVFGGHFSLSGEI